MSDELNVENGDERARGGPGKSRSSDVKRALDAAKLADKKEQQKKNAELSRAVGIAFKNKAAIQQGSGRR